ncbi:DeoR/GlpR family DNA-binding transcription regulator [Streptomyces sp. NPDC046805]|uniref:DeoR/GlpR family DNA-binding transcription regulator n=1 Tax=Streptomyces sp. NPDC046805 TaxID=3155134 RepID=UPI0033DB668B
MLRQIRHQRLLQLLQEKGALPVGEIAALLGVSEATARRDLGVLSQNGQLTRIYGGAVAVAHANDEPLFGSVAEDDADDKDAVARHAAALVADGDVVLLDIGTTVVRLARQLHGRRITVVTSNLAVYEELRDDETVSLVLLGGEVRRNYHSLVGFLTEANLSQLHVDRLFLGTSGVGPDGSVLDTTLVEVPVKRAMVAAARQVVLLATAAKFPGSGIARVSGPDEVDLLVTNKGADPATIAVLSEAGVKVVLA